MSVCAGSLLLHKSFLWLWRAGATPHHSTRASHCRGFSCIEKARGAWASEVVAWGLSRCGTWAQLLHGMWNPPGPEIQPVSPALAGRLLSTVPPGKFLFVDFLMIAILRDVKVRKSQSLSRIQLFVSPWTVAHQAPLFT